jgi:hypothetical protein
MSMVASPPMGRIAGALLCVGMLALMMVGISNCYSPPDPACGFLCNAGNGFGCPDGYSCSHAAGVCVSSTAPAGMRCFADAAPTPEGIDGDATAPMIVTTTPANGDVNVEPSAPIAIQLTQVVEPINMTTVQILDGTTQIPYAFTFNGTTLIMTPEIFLPGGHTIEVTLDGLVNTTSLHVPLASTSFSFTTRDDVAPVLVLSAPLDLATAVPVTTTIVVTFSEPVAGVDVSSFTVFHGATQLAGTITVNANATQWTFTPTAALPAASQITVMLASAIHDLAANALTPTMFTFTTQ